MLWTWIGSPLSAPPTPGFAGVDKGNPQIATRIWHSNLDKDGNDQMATIDQLLPDNILIITSLADSNIWLRYRVTASPGGYAPPSPNPGYYIPVAYDASQNWPNTYGGDVDIVLETLDTPEQPPEQPPDEVLTPEDRMLDSPYETSHEVEVSLGVGQNPTNAVVVAESLYPFQRGRFGVYHKVTGDGPQTRKRIAPVDPIIG